MIKIRYTARKAPAGYVARVEITGESGEVHLQEGYDYHRTPAAALNDASNLAWEFADRLGTDDVERKNGNA